MLLASSLDVNVEGEADVARSDSVHEAVGAEEWVGFVGHAGQLDVGATLLVLDGQVDVGVWNAISSCDVPWTALTL